MATLNIKGFPEKLYKALKKRAEMDHRSVTQEVVFLLQIAIEEAEKPSILTLRGLGKTSWKGIETTKHINTERDSWD